MENITKILLLDLNIMNSNTKYYYYKKDIK